eukprot:c9652_g2_i1.p1 GENE.c9652_g2_i1~~c9652_g2_i1.p1  ORF type:complete len:374 (-),score=98.20 c9652_g2_i1:108-1229(-)
MTASLVLFDPLPIPEPFHYEIVFEPKACKNQKQKAHYLSQLTQYRENFRYALQTSSTFEHQIQAAEAFVAILIDVASQRKGNTTLKMKFMNFQWKTCLHNENLEFAQNDISEFDVSMSLLTLGYITVNHATKHYNNQDDPDAIKMASQEFRKAAGIFQFLLVTVTEKWINLPRGRPVEVLKPVVQCLIDLCLAQAHQLAIVQGERTKTIGPAVLSKLLRHVVDSFEHANSCLQQLGEADRGVLNLDFKQFINLQVLLNRAKLCKVMAAQAYEQEKYGEAIAYLEKSIPSLNLLEGVPVRRTGRGLTSLYHEIDAEIPKIRQLLQGYKHDNSTIYFQEVPQDSKLKFPEAKSLFTFVPFQVPPLPVDRVDLKAA